MSKMHFDAVGVNGWAVDGEIEEVPAQHPHQGQPKQRRNLRIRGCASQKEALHHINSRVSSFGYQQAAAAPGDLTGPQKPPKQQQHGVYFAGRLLAQRFSGPADLWRAPKAFCAGVQVRGSGGAFACCAEACNPPLPVVCAFVSVTYSGCLVGRVREQQLESSAPQHAWKWRSSRRASFCAAVDLTFPRIPLIPPPSHSTSTATALATPSCGPPTQRSSE